MNVDQLISELLLREDRRAEVQILLPDGDTCPIKDLVDSKTHFTPPEIGPHPEPVVLIRLGNL